METAQLLLGIGLTIILSLVGIVLAFVAFCMVFLEIVGKNLDFEDQVPWAFGAAFAIGLEFVVVASVMRIWQ